MFRKVLDNAVEGLCLVLMIALTVDLMLGVFSRYVLVRTFTWYDEIARICFVWMVFLGAAVGVKRHSHFRLRLAVDRLGVRAGYAAEMLAFVVVLVVAGVLIRQGLALMELAQFQHTPVMGLPKSWVYLAIPVGGILMAVYSVRPVLRRLREVLGWSSR